MQKRGVSLFISLALVFSLTACGGGSSTSQESFIVGSGAVTVIKSQDRKAAPQLAGITLTGEQFSFETGKVGVVNVWASWCSPCRAEIPALIALSQQYASVQFMGILTRDNLVAAEAFARNKAMPYPTFIDDALLIGFKGTLPANAIPSTVLIDKQGRVAARISGAITLTSLSDLIRKLDNE
jgi:thiol-disulfide isomerase/thioredoxin